MLLSAATRHLVDTPTLELGEHRFKDFEQPVAVYQLGHSRFPPLRTMSNTNLPRPTTSFLGRTREVDDLVSHDSYGMGRVVNVEAAAVTVDFRSQKVRVPSPFRKMSRL